jgi:hypothetical protein
MKEPLLWFRHLARTHAWNNLQAGTTAPIGVPPHILNIAVPCRSPASRCTISQVLELVGFFAQQFGRCPVSVAAGQIRADSQKLHGIDDKSFVLRKTYGVPGNRSFVEPLNPLAMMT